MMYGNLSLNERLFALFSEEASLIMIKEKNRVDRFMDLFYGKIAIFALCQRQG